MVEAKGILDLFCNGGDGVFLIKQNCIWGLFVVTLMVGNLFVG